MANALRFIVLVTYGRTGSTVLQAALNAQPGVLVRGENYEALRGVRAYLQSIAETASRHHAGKPDHPWFGSARMQPRDIREGMRAHVIQSVLRPRASTEWLGFKEIRYTSAHWSDYDLLLEYLLFLNTLLPGARYLFNVRDPAQAMRSAWWRAEPDAADILTTTQAWLTDAHRDLSRLLGDGRSQLLDYAQWSQDHQCVDRALRHFGMRVDSDALTRSLSAHLTHGQRR